MVSMGPIKPGCATCGKDPNLCLCDLEKRAERYGRSVPVTLPPQIMRAIAADTPDKHYEQHLWGCRSNVIEYGKVVDQRDLYCSIEWRSRRPFTITLREYVQEPLPDKVWWARGPWKETGRHQDMFLLEFIVRFVWYRLRGRAWKLDIPRARALRAGVKALLPPGPDSGQDTCQAYEAGACLNVPGTERDHIACSCDMGDVCPACPPPPVPSSSPGPTEPVIDPPVALPIPGGGVPQKR